MYGIDIDYTNEFYCIIAYNWVSILPDMLSLGILVKLQMPADLLCHFNKGNIAITGRSHQLEDDMLSCSSGSGDEFQTLDIQGNEMDTDIDLVGSVLANEMALGIVNVFLD